MPKFLDKKGLQLLWTQISLAIQTAKEEMEDSIATKIQAALSAQAQTTGNTVDPQTTEQGEENDTETGENEAEGSVL